MPRTRLRREQEDCCDENVGGNPEGRLIQFEARKPKPATPSPIRMRATRQPSSSISHLASSGINSVPSPVPDKAMPDAIPRLRSLRSSLSVTIRLAPGSRGRFWSYGAIVLQTVFDAGARSAQVEQTRAIFDQDVATYRQTVLTAFQQVEDQLAAMRILAQEADVQDKAVAAAFEAARIINNQYLSGIVPYTNVIVANETALADAETAVSIRQSRLVASAALIQALGGGWDVTQLPSRNRIEEDAPLNFSPFPPTDQVRAQ